MPKTLLLADDSVTIQKVVGITFANEDVELVTENNGDAALARAKEIVPDVVLADISMPGLNGYELCHAIKTDAQLSHVPVILLTGTFESYDEERTHEVGADGHIAKPFEAQALVDLVHETLRKGASATPAAADPVEAPAAADPSVAAPVPDLMPEPAADPNAQTILTPEPEALSLDLSVPAAAAPEANAADQSPILTPPPSPEPAGLAFADFGEPDETPSGDATHVFDAGAPVDSDPNQATQLVTPESQPPPPAVPSLDPLATPSLDAAGTPAPVEDVASMETMLAPNPGADAPAPPTEPEVDAVLYDETSFLDPRAPLSNNAAAAPVVDPDPPIETSPTPAIEPVFDDDNPESQIFGAPTASSGFDSGARIANDDTAPEIARDTQTMLAAEEALDAVSALPPDPVPVAPSLGDTGLSWAEPLEVADDCLTAPDPVEGDPLDEPEFSPLPTPEPPERLTAAAPVDADPVMAKRLTADPGLGEATPSEPTLDDPDSEATPPPTTELPIDPADLHAAIERVAWEAFGTISEQVVSEVVKKVEEVAWEVIPQLAEKIIKDEIVKLKS